MVLFLTVSHSLFLSIVDGAIDVRWILTICLDREKGWG